MDIRIEKREKPLEKPTGALGFGKYFTDYMFILDWDEGQGWHDARIVPYGPLLLDPASMVLHYAQETFEGLKAYHADDGRTLLFRPEANAERFYHSNERLSMPTLPKEDFVEIIEKFIRFQKDWVPTAPLTSLYIRPFMYARQRQIGVEPATAYSFVIILSPVGAYYTTGLDPVRIYVEDEYVRATAGGTGFCKCGGNYAASLAAQVKAEKLGYAQVLWLDGVERRYVEEVGSMNVMFLIDGKVVTAPIDGTVLPGVTRDSAITLLKDFGYEVEERHLDIHDLMQAGRDGKLQEAWGTGTAAVISPIGELFYEGEKVIIHHSETGALTKKLFDTLTGIQWGKLEDKFGWVREVK